jgi:polyisoprenoid-binding protein YceI
MRLSLGPVTLDTDRRQVFRGSEPLHVSAKAFQLLELLVENRPRALSKDELQGALWPDTFVSDTSLTTLVNELRAELGESAREPRLIRTVHGFGYAFEAEGAAASGARLVWGAMEVPLYEGENVLGRDPRRLGVAAPRAAHAVGRHRDPRGSRKQERHVRRRASHRHTDAARRRRCDPARPRDAGLPRREHRGLDENGRAGVSRRPILAAALLLASAALHAAQYTIDTAGSNVQFSVPLMVVSKVTGKFVKYDVTVHAGKNPDLSQASVTAVIEMGSVDTGNDAWDAKLKTPAYFDAVKYPEIRFKSRKVRKAGDRWEAVGPLTLHGVTKEITLPFTFEGRFEDPNADAHIGLHASFQFDRRQYGMAWAGNTEAKAVGNMVTVEITLLANRVRTSRKGP